MQISLKQCSLYITVKLTNILKVDTTRSIKIASGQKKVEGYVLQILLDEKNVKFKKFGLVFKPSLLS